MTDKEKLKVIEAFVKKGQEAIEIKLACGFHHLSGKWGLEGLISRLSGGDIFRVKPTPHRWQNLIDFIKSGDFKGKNGVRFGKPCADLTELQEFLFKNGYSWCFTGSESVKSYPSEMTLNHNENRTYLVNSDFSPSDYLYYNPDTCQFVEEKPVLVPWTREDVPLCILRHKDSGSSYTILNFNTDGVRLFGISEAYHYSYKILLESYEYSTDNKTWKPCGKEGK